MSNEQDNAIIRSEVQNMRDILERGGWVIANGAQEQKSADGVVWFSTTYTHGEYTVEASYRPSGVGVSEGRVRVRITPSIVRAHPRLARELAQDLLDVETAPIDPKVWPPPIWKSLAR